MSEAYCPRYPSPGWGGGRGSCPSPGQRVSPDWGTPIKDLGSEAGVRLERPGTRGWRRNLEPEAVVKDLGPEAGEGTWDQRLGYLSCEQMET